SAVTSENVSSLIANSSCQIQAAGICNTPLSAARWYPSPVDFQADSDARRKGVIPGLVSKISPWTEHPRCLHGAQTLFLPAVITTLFSGYSRPLPLLRANLLRRIGNRWLTGIKCSVM